MSTYSEEQIRDLIGRASFLTDDYVREHLAYLRSSLKKYGSRKSPRHQVSDWSEVEDYADRIETRLVVLSKGVSKNSPLGI